LTNFGPASVSLPDGEILLTSAPLTDDEIPANTTVWWRPAGPSQQH